MQATHLVPTVPATVPTAGTERNGTAAGRPRPSRVRRRGSVQGVEQDLQRLLDELSAAIGRTRQGDADQDELRRLVDAIEHRLQSDAAAEEQPKLIEALRRAEVRFEADHPVLGETIRRAIDALSAAGTGTARASPSTRPVPVLRCHARKPT